MNNSTSVCRYFIGVSGGHSKSVAIGWDTIDNRILGPIYGEPINTHRIESTSVLERFDGLINAFGKEVQPFSGDSFLTDISGIGVALPGVDTELDIRRITILLKKAFYKQPSLVVLDDTLAGIYDRTLSETGICAFAGTGAAVTVALGSFSFDSVRKLDGWGPILGDRGGAFSLVAAFLHEALALYDKGSVHPLFSIVTQKMQKPNFADPKGLRNWFDSIFYHDSEKWSATIAELSRYISDLAEPPYNYPEAIQLLTNAGKELAKTVNLAVDRFGAHSMPLVFQGGLLKGSAIYRQAVVENLINFTGKIHFGEGPEFGALYYVMKSNSIDQAKAAFAADKALKRSGLPRSQDYTEQFLTTLK